MKIQTLLIVSVLYYLYAVANKKKALQWEKHRNAIK